MLINELEAVARGETETLLVFMPPGSAKSTYVNLLFPSWWMANNPTEPVLTASHSITMAERWGRKTRNLIEQHSVILGVNVSQDKSAAGDWTLKSGGEYKAAGAGMGIAGIRAGLGIIDDPFGSREDAESKAIRESRWNWYLDDFSSRLKPGAPEVIMHCLVGETPIQMADGTEKPISDLRVGDKVATYDCGSIGVEIVQNWKSQGVDAVFEIETASGCKVKGNERHPFLVERNGRLEWIRIKDLLLTDAIIRAMPSTGNMLESCASMRGVNNPLRSEDFALDARQTIFVPDPIIRVTPAGKSEVFDIQVSRTSNFIAAGLVSHNTRWHDDDLAGRRIRQLESLGINHRVLIIKAEAEANDPLGRKPGELLWDDPKGYNYGAVLRREKQKVTARSWASLYQQNPVPDEGALFRAEWFHATPSLPKQDTMRFYGASDYAVTSDGGDYTVHVVIGIDPDNRMYLVDLWRQQASSDVWVEAFCDLVRKWRPLAWAEETGQIKAGVGPFLERRMRDRQAYTMREQFPTRGDKAVRAQSIIGRMSLDGLYIAENAPWRSDLISECLRFPAGVHDDQVDALGLAGQLLDKMVAGQKPKEDKPKQDSGYKSKSAFGGNSFRTY